MFASLFATFGYISPYYIGGVAALLIAVGVAIFWWQGRPVSEE